MEGFEVAAAGEADKEEVFEPEMVGEDVGESLKKHFGGNVVFGEEVEEEVGFPGVVSGKLAEVIGKAVFVHEECGGKVRGFIIIEQFFERVNVEDSGFEGAVFNLEKLEAKLAGQEEVLLSGLEVVLKVEGFGFRIKIRAYGFEGRVGGQAGSIHANAV